MGWESKPRSFCLLLIFTPSVLTLLVLMLLVLIMRMRGAGVRPAFGVMLAGLNLLACPP